VKILNHFFSISFFAHPLAENVSNIVLCDIRRIRLFLGSTTVLSMFAVLDLLDYTKPV